jgi:predicted ester cyclase
MFCSYRVDAYLPDGVMRIGFEFLEGLFVDDKCEDEHCLCRHVENVRRNWFREQPSEEFSTAFLLADPMDVTTRGDVACYRFDHLTGVRLFYFRISTFTPLLYIDVEYFPMNNFEFETNQERINERFAELWRDHDV